MVNNRADVALDVYMPARWKSAGKVLGNFWPQTNSNKKKNHGKERGKEEKRWKRDVVQRNSLSYLVDLWEKSLIHGNGTHSIPSPLTPPKLLHPPTPHRREIPFLWKFIAFFGEKFASQKMLKNPNNCEKIWNFPKTLGNFCKFFQNESKFGRRSYRCDFARERVDWQRGWDKRGIVIRITMQRANENCW